MKRIIIIMLMLMLMSCNAVNVSASTSTYQMAKAYAKEHHAKIEKVVTISKGGYKGKVKGTKYNVRYPKKVKKGKRVTVYMIEKKGDIIAMVCLHKIK